MPRDTLAELSDDTLLVLYANCDREASRLLTARLTPRLFGYAARLLGDRAESILLAVHQGARNRCGLAWLSVTQSDIHLA